RVRRTNLPAALTDLIGRSVAIADLTARLEQGARLITLTSPGGVGKTSLALAAAGRFGDEAWLVELASRSGVRSRGGAGARGGACGDARPRTPAAGAGQLRTPGRGRGRGDDPTAPRRPGAAGPGHQP